jgi:outer membrane cobalamin receptor
MALAGTAVAQTPGAIRGTGSNDPTPAADNTVELEEVEVTGQRLDLLGTATTASQGVIDNQEIQLTPVYRPGQILETIPGLTVTSHSGEGKAKSVPLARLQSGPRH